MILVVHVSLLASIACAHGLPSNYRSVLMAGETGVGKSETLNTILEESFFSVSGGFKSETLHVSHSSTTYSGMTIRMLDSPGFFDTALSQGAIQGKFAELARQTDRGVDVFAIVFEYGRFNRLSLKPYQVFKDVFGDAALKHSMAVFTKCGSRTEASILNEMRLVCEGEPQHNICIIMNEIGAKNIVAFGDLKQERKARDRNKFLDVAVSLLEDNNDEPYPHHVFEEIREKRSRLVERVTPLKKQFHKVFGLYVDRMQAGEMSELEFEAALMKAESESSTFYKALSNFMTRLKALPPAHQEQLRKWLDRLHEGQEKIEDFESRLREAEFFLSSILPGLEHRVKALSTNRQQRLNPLLGNLSHEHQPIKEFEDQLRGAEAEEWTEWTECMQDIVWKVLAAAATIGACLTSSQLFLDWLAWAKIVSKVLTTAAAIGAWMKWQYQKAMAQAWANKQISILEQVHRQYAPDIKWAESIFSRLHTTAKIQTLNQSSIIVVEREQWENYAESLLGTLIREDAEEPKMRLRAELDAVPLVRTQSTMMFDMSFNYEAGGSQYMSCLRFGAWRKKDKSIAIMYSLFGRRWQEQRDYALSSDFWESPSKIQRFNNYLEAYAAKNLAEKLALPDATQALQE